MRLAIISDIHGNLEALQAVLADVERQSPEVVICLGDLIGYGPDPEAVVQVIVEHGIESIIGNHETALNSARDRRWMNFQTRENNIATEKLLSRTALEYCTSLPRTLNRCNALFVHGCPPDSVLKYLSMLADGDIREALKTTCAPICFVGHTHELSLVAVTSHSITRDQLSEGSYQLDPDARYLVNAGSVGQPRDGNTKAKYVLWDAGSNLLEVRALTYPSHLTAEKILDRGFPATYAMRICD